MELKKIGILLSLSAAAALFAGCGQQPAPQTAPPAKTPAIVAPSPQAAASAPANLAVSAGIDSRIDELNKTEAAIRELDNLDKQMAELDDVLNSLDALDSAAPVK